MKKIYHKSILYYHLTKDAIYWRNKDTLTGINKNYSDFYFKGSTTRMKL